MVAGSCYDQPMILAKNPQIGRWHGVAADWHKIKDIYTKPKKNMELYIINIHFNVPMTNGEPQTYTLTHTELYENDEAAARAAQVLRQTLRKIGRFVFWLESAGGNIIWTDQSNEVKELIKYKLLRNPPAIRFFEELLR